MSQARMQTTHQDSPELLISFLRYALDDVRALSERSGRHLELAISTLAEDTSVIDMTEEEETRSLRQQSWSGRR